MEVRYTAWCQLCLRTPSQSSPSHWMLSGSQHWNVCKMRTKIVKYIWHIQILWYEQFQSRWWQSQECEKDFCRHTVRYIEMILLPDRLIWSSWVRTELTTRIASEGSVPAWQAFLAAVRLSTCHPETSFINRTTVLQEAHKKEKRMVKCVWHNYLIDQHKDKSIFVINELLDLLEHLCHKFTTLIKKKKNSYLVK